MASQRRKVSLHGCVTCRARKIKCDEKRPRCSRCSQSKIRCGGYEAAFRWIFCHLGKEGRRNGFHHVEEIGHGRRLLFTDRERIAMSKQVVASAASYRSFLEGKDTTFEDEQRLRNDFANAKHTCFHVFRVKSADCSHEDLCQPDHLSVSEPMLDSIASATVQHVVTPPLSGQSIFGDDNDESWPISSSERSGPEERAPMDNLSSHGLIGNVLQSLPSRENGSVPPYAEFLITHYRNNMGNWFSPLHSSKHPWAVLHLPVALTTLSELHLWGETKHARAAILHSLLSLSAFTLAPDDGSGHWRTVASQCRTIAREAMKESLASEFDGPGKAKYKDMLLAFLTLISISVASGQHCDTRTYLLDAERLICARGFRKSITSRKKLLLHYYFLYLRVIEESTHIYDKPMGATPTLQQMKSQGFLQFPSIQTHSLRNRQAINALSGTSFETRLLSPSSSSPSVLMDIYGIPLSLFSLISRATHLANEKEASHMNQVSGITKEMASQIKRLEGDICSWDFRDASDTDFDSRRLASEGSLKNRKMLQHVVSAMHGGLILYFYRRCYNISAMVLQSYVDEILQHLQAVEEEKLALKLLNTSPVWPGFLAAVEAQGEHRKQTALSWLRANALRSGWGSFTSAADVVEELWKRQAESDPQLTWVDLLRGRGTALFLS